MSDRGQRPKMLANHTCHFCVVCLGEFYNRKGTSHHPRRQHITCSTECSQAWYRASYKARDRMLDAHQKYMEG